MARKGERITTLPLEPLEKLAQAATGLERYSGGRMRVQMFTDKLFAEMIGASERALARWRANGGQVPWPSADVAAIRLGTHPVLVWGQEWLDLDADYVAAEAAREGASA